MNPRTLLLLLAGPLLLAACASVPAPPAFEVLENSLGMKFVRLPAGEFLMGSDETPQALARDYPQHEAWRFSELADEAPVHRVRISRPFFLGQHEVTVGQFRRFLQASGHVPESVADGTGGYGYNPAHGLDASGRGDLFEGRDPKYSWRNPGFAQDDSHPVLNVTWNDAVAMSRWLSRQEGRRYRLPTEAEWEYACRAGSASRYPSGNRPESLRVIANTFDAEAARHWPALRAQAQPGSDGHAFTAPAGSFRPNAFGLHDMLGNAWEWTADWHDEAYYAASPAADPPGPADGTVRVRRGGSWHTWALYSRCSYRNWNSAQTRYTLVGMRLLLEADGAQRRPLEK
ncbi:MAG: recombination protein RecF [Polaromonas sp.]|nr:recombination protein RecF [Polaromonas sp.]